jgi:hypothetical protein
MSLKILTWNISYGYGMGSDGLEGYHQLPERHFEETLSAMATLIKKVDADIVLLQEVDFDSKRSHHQNQLEILSRKSNLLYRSECVTWDRLYVPYPGLNPFHHFGRVKSGGGILSKFPIEKIQSDLLPKPRENTKAYNYFYLHRFLQMVEIAGVRICNLHLEAFSKDNRELHLIRLQDRLLDYQIDLAAGDFNDDILLPEKASTLYSALPAPRPTFPSSEPKETLDGFIIKKTGFQNPRISVPDSGQFSDHLPVLFEID